MNQTRIALAFLLFCAGSAFAQAPATYHYLPPNSVNIRSVLSGPPAPGSAQSQADIQAVLARQQARTPAAIARATSEQTLTPAAFATVIGNEFTAENLPATFALLNNAASDAEAISDSAKTLWQRPRPPLQNPAIHPIFALPSTPSYPSGHAMRGVLWSMILAKLDPDHETSLLARGTQIGEDRIIAGVHFPSDVAAGQKLGRYLAARFLSDARFDHDLERAQEELTFATR